MIKHTTFSISLMLITLNTTWEVNTIFKESMWYHEIVVFFSLSKALWLFSRQNVNNDEKIEVFIRLAKQSPLCSVVDVKGWAALSNSGNSFFWLGYNQWQNSKEEEEQNGKGKVAIKRDTWETDNIVNTGGLNMVMILFS